MPLASARSMRQIGRSAPHCARNSELILLIVICGGCVLVFIARFLAWATSNKPLPQLGRLEDRNLRGWKPRGVDDVIMAIDDVEEQVAEVLTDSAFAPAEANSPGPQLEIRPGDPGEDGEGSDEQGGDEIGGEEPGEEAAEEELPE